MKEKPKFHLGQKVIFDEMYFRTSTIYPETQRPESGVIFSGSKQNRMYKFWKSYKIPTSKGIIVGLRRFSNGISELYSYEGWIYTPKESIYVALVATNIRHSIVKVPVENIILDLEE